VGKLTKAQLAALDQLIAAMAADRVEAATISADFTDDFAAIVDAYVDAANDVVDAYREIANQFAEAGQAVADALGGDVVLPADRATRLGEALKGRGVPTLEELVALRQKHR
jgi:hypothetical protein